MTAPQQTPPPVTQPFAAPQQNPLQLVTPPHTAFEGNPVEGVAIKLSGAANVEGLDGEEELSIGDLVRLVGEYRVVGVNFKKNANGELIREETLKIAVASFCPFDPTDPNDKGIIRSKPGQP